MLECEIKLLDINMQEIIARLDRIGAKHYGSELIVDVYLKRKKLLNTPRARVRYLSDKTMLTLKYKLPTTDTKSAYEIESLLPTEFFFDKAQWSKLVDHVRVKKRTTYTRGGFHFDIDQYRGLPPIMEIEGPSGKSIQKAVSLLGLQKYKQFTGGATNLYTHYETTMPAVGYTFLSRLLAVIRSWELFEKSIGSELFL